MVPEGNDGCHVPHCTITDGGFGFRVRAILQPREPLLDSIEGDDNGAMVNVAPIGEIIAKFKVLPPPRALTQHP